MDNPHTPSIADNVDLRSSQPHRLLMTEDVLQSIFAYLDTSHLKQCRLTCSAWTPSATKFLMKRTYCAVKPTGRNSRRSFKIPTKSITSLKVNKDLLDELISKKLPSSFIMHCKSILVSLAAVPSEISALNSFLNLISSDECPELSHMRIDFTAETQNVAQRSTSDSGQWNHLVRLRRTTRERLQGEGRPILPSEVHAIKNPSAIRSLHLSFENTMNFLQVSNGFFQVFLKKNVLPNLKELVIQFSDSNRIRGSNGFIEFHTEYKRIVEELGKCDDVLCSLRTFKIQGHIPFGMSEHCSNDLFSFMSYVLTRELPAAKVKLGLSSDTKEIQVGSWLIEYRSRCVFDPTDFLPGVLTPSVASGLQSLNISGFFLYECLHNVNPLVNFPNMPCLQKLTVEEMTFMWIRNFPKIFEKAPGIREFRVKSSWADWKKDLFFSFAEALMMEQWEEKLGLGKYPSLRILELGKSCHVNDSKTLRNLTEIFPNVEVFQFNVDDTARRLPREHKWALCDMDFIPLQKIVDGLEGWKSLKHLSLTYWPLLTIDEILDHFIDCALKLRSLRLYDFRRSDDVNPIVRWEEVHLEHLRIRMQEKVTRLKYSPEVLFVLHNFHCSNPHHEIRRMNRLLRCSMMEDLFLFAEKEGILNFREGSK